MKSKLDHSVMSILGRSLLALTLVCVLLLGSALPTAAVSQTNLVGPAGSGQFGFDVIALPNGNLVVIDPYFDSGTAADVGAVYLYDGFTRNLISTLTGSTTNDLVGIFGVKVLTNGNFVVLSAGWDNGSTVDAGAITWGSATIGVSGVVSSSNSLVGSIAYDRVGFYAVTLTNGNYATYAPFWDAPGPVSDVGAATWGDGTGGTVGEVSSSNSLVGSTASDGESSGVTVLTNSNYVVSNPHWDNEAKTNAGAATWVNGSTGLPVGPISSSNSLVGNTSNDNVSGSCVIALTNGNYVVCSPVWDDVSTVNAGAATWVNGSNGLPVGLVSSSNSLAGSTLDDVVSTGGVIALTNGNYAVSSWQWNGSAVNVGAVTWGNGTTGTTGMVSYSNSLTGSIANDQVGERMTALTNGNYVVGSTGWDNGGTADVGAATWVYGVASSSGTVNSANSLIGSSTSDNVGLKVIALTNGNYVVNSQDWDSGGAVDAGAATWGNGTIGTVGVISSSNSLVGSQDNDQVGELVTALSNGNYVVSSIFWDNGATPDVGAVTWGNGVSGATVGTVSLSNSLVGSQAGNQTGGLVIALTNSNYVVSSRYWDNEAALDAGAVTWCNGVTGTVGQVSTANSLVGSHTDDYVGVLEPLTNGDYIIYSSNWDYGASSNSGAVTWGLGTGGLTDSITPENSVLGLVMNGGLVMNYTHNTVYGYLAVGRPAENLVTLFWLPRLYLPVGRK